MVKNLVMRLLAYLFPITDMGVVEISSEQMSRRRSIADERFWGGRPPILLSWTTDEPVHILSNNLQRRAENGEYIPAPLRVIG
jgi:hypothetical protein